MKNKNMTTLGDEVLVIVAGGEGEEPESTPEEDARKYWERAAHSAAKLNKSLAGIM